MQDLEKIVLPIIRNTRSITLPHFGKAEVSATKGKYAHDVVTKLDQEVEIHLRDELKKHYPDVDFAGEEFGGSRDGKKFWLVDPIDGTGLYVRGMIGCTTMLALIEDGQVTFSVIYDFVNDVMYHAEKGKGAFKNGKKIKVSERGVENSYLCWETHLDKPENLKIFVELRGHSVLFKALCSGYEYALVAEGKLEGRITLDPWGHDYDFAPGALLVQEAGGVVTNFGTENYDYRNLNFIAANASLHKKLSEIIRDVI